MVVSTQHAEDVDAKTLEDAIRNVVIAPELEIADLDTSDVRYYINPTGRFVVGGPQGDARLRSATSNESFGPTARADAVSSDTVWSCLCFSTSVDVNIKSQV